VVKAELRVAVSQLKGPGRHIRVRELAARVSKAKRIAYEWYLDGRRWLSDEVQVLAGPSQGSET
jgi:hypothetical protein